MAGRSLIAGAIALCLLGGSAAAHHSISATYRENQSVTLQGQLVQFQLRNPHSFVQMMVREADGNDVRYAIEWRGAGELVTQGVRNDTLRVGDHIVVTGNPSRQSADHRVRLTRLVRPRDGFAWTLQTPAN